MSKAQSVEATKNPLKLENRVPPLKKQEQTQRALSGWQSFLRQGNHWSLLRRGVTHNYTCTWIERSCGRTIRSLAIAMAQRKNAEGVDRDSGGAKEGRHKTSLMHVGEGH